MTSYIPAIAERVQRLRARALSARYRVGGGYRRIYHYHVRKSAGTSLNSAFWGLAGADFSGFDRYRMIRKGYVFVHHLKPLIEEGHYFFANSHRPAYDLELPPRTFTITILRDPLRRLLSYYRYILWARDDPKAPTLDPAYEILLAEVRRLGGSFGEFVRNSPKRHILTQLQMFSATYDPEEAADRVLACSAVGFTEQFNELLHDVSGRLALPLQPRRERQFGSEVVVTPEELEEVRELLRPEFTLVERVRRRARSLSA